MFTQNDNNLYDDHYTPNGYDKSKVKKILLIIIGVFILLGVIALIIQLSTHQTKQDKYTQSASAAAKKQTPNAKVSDVRVADGFAIAIVSDPTANNQANGGNTTIFKVNKDDSMSQIASGSYLNPIDLLNMGIPLATQAKLKNSSLDMIK